MWLSIQSILVRTDEKCYEFRKHCTQFYKILSELLQHNACRHPPSCPWCYNCHSSLRDSIFNSVPYLSRHFEPFAYLSSSPSFQNTHIRHQIESAQHHLHQTRLGLDIPILLLHLFLQPIWYPYERQNIQISYLDGYMDPIHELVFRSCHSCTRHRLFRRGMHCDHAFRRTHHRAYRHVLHSIYTSCYTAESPNGIQSPPLNF